jgi:NTE family protein
MATKKIAVVLAGAVAKGAFEAGALAELTTGDVEIHRVVGASSGALNATVLAAAAHRAESPQAVSSAMEELCTLWVERGGLRHAFNVKLWDLVRVRGASDQADLRALLEAAVRPCRRGAHGQDVVLTVVVSTLMGSCGPEHPDDSTFEKALRFTGADFETSEGLDAVFAAAVASASFPIAFVPSEVSGVGPCVDGGTVNNTPLKYALKGAPEIDAVVVVAPTPADARIDETVAASLRASGLVGRISEMLVNERLYRDLAEARWTNDAIRRLERHPVFGAHTEAILACMGLAGRRVVPVHSIRPETELEGHAFEGFYKPRLRAAYVAAGRERARAVLTEL